MMDGSKLLCFVFFSSMILSAGNGIAQDHDFSFAKELFRQGDYFRSITEAKRFIFNNPDSALKENVLILIADAYALGGDHKEALSRYRAFISEYPKSAKKAEVVFKIGKLYAEDREYEKAAAYFADVANHDPAPELSRKASYWLFLMNLFEKRQAGADKIMESMQSSADRNTLEDYKREYNLLPFKSPAVAGTLAAVVPGAGHLYVGRKSDAFAAFLLNGLFIWGIVESFNKNDVGVGVTLSLFELGWYAGNIYSAVNSAHKHNRHLKDSFKLRFTVESNLLARGTDSKIGLVIYANF